MSIPVDITAAIVAYLQQIMGGSLGVTPTNPAVWAEYAPDVDLPYCVVSEGDPETYSFQSDDLARSGFYTSVLANGHVYVSFVATSKQEVKSLARECVRKIADTVANLFCDDGTILELRPESAMTIPATETGPSTPTVFRRTVVVRYTQQFSV